MLFCYAMLVDLEVDPFELQVDLRGPRPYLLIGGHSQFSSDFKNSNGFGKWASLSTIWHHFFVSDELKFGFSGPKFGPTYLSEK